MAKTIEENNKNDKPTDQDIKIAKTIAIGSKLPYGLILESPVNPNIKVEINGINSSSIINATHGITIVDAEFWDAWIAVNADFPAIKSGAIFAAAGANDLSAIAKEYSKRDTGLEPMSTDGKDKRAAGVKAEK